jgi:membrane-bound ClpP family serine protease
MMDRRLTIYSVKSRTGPEWRLITQEELDHDIQEAQKGGERKWGQERLVKKGGEEGTLLTLRASDDEKDDAQKLGIARHVVGDLRELYAAYGVPPEQVRVAGPDWLDELAAFLRSSTVSVFLVMLGITCLILELKLPGVGLPGVVAALCFVLFFWAHSQLAGQITMLAVLLFVLGLILLGLEIFVLPGFGVVGLSGAVLLVVSLALVTLEKKPETTEEWISFGTNVATFAASAVGAVVAALVLAWYLPNIPYVNRLILKPEAEQAEVEEAAPEAIQPELAALLGAIGVAATPLRPAGKAQFGEDFVDVVAEGSYVQPGTRVQVIEIEGNRVVVKEV